MHWLKHWQRINLFLIDPNISYRLWVTSWWHWLLHIDFYNITLAHFLFWLLDINVNVKVILMLKQTRCLWEPMQVDLYCQLVWVLLPSHMSVKEYKEKEKILSNFAQSIFSTNLEFWNQIDWDGGSCFITNTYHTWGSHNPGLKFFDLSVRRQIIRTLVEMNITNI